MDSQYPSSLRQRRSIQSLASDSAEFTGSQNSIDERTILQLFRRPTLSSCIYRANEFLCFLCECLMSMGPKLVLIVAFPVVLALMIVFAMGKSSLLIDTNPPSNQKILQFNFIVVSSCYSLIFFVIAVDYSKVQRISRAAIEIRRLHHSQQKALSESNIPNEGRKEGTTQFIHQLTLSTQQINEINESDKEAEETMMTNDSTKAKDSQGDSVLPTTSYGAQDSQIQYLRSWWGTYSILRLNLHCFIYQIKSTIKLMIDPSLRNNRRRKSYVRKLNHYLLQPLKGNFAKLSAGIFLVIAAISMLTGLKHFHNWSTDSQTSDWLIHKFLWTISLAGYLTLHFVTLLVIAAVVSNSPSRINIVRLIGRWLLALLACIAIKLAVLPDMHPIPKCTTAYKIDNGFFAVFTDMEMYIDSPLVNSIGESRPKVIFLLGSLITAITAAFLYQFTILQMTIGSVGTTFEFILGVSPIEGVVLLLNLFATPTNFLILFMPFLAKMSESELFCIFVLMLVKTPSENDEYWIYKGSSDSNNTTSYLHMKIQATNQSTYMPQRLAIRSLLVFPLIILFCRVIYPTGGKISARSSQFRQLSSLKYNRPFQSLGESLLFFVSYCLRSLCRYFVMIVLFHCVEFLFRFVGEVIEFKIGHKKSTESAIVQLSSIFISAITDLTEFYPSKGRRLSGYIVRKFFYPKTTFQNFFILDDYLTRNRVTDPILDSYHEISTPIKEIVVSGSLSWDTIVVFVAFTIDFLTSDRRTSIGFIIRGCLAAVLIYAAMQNLMYLTCNDQSLRQLYNISSEWINTIERSANLTAEEC